MNTTQTTGSETVTVLATPAQLAVLNQLAGAARTLRACLTDVAADAAEALEVMDAGTKRPAYSAAALFGSSAVTDAHAAIGAVNAILDLSTPLGLNVEWCTKALTGRVWFAGDES